jgi:hypothetical protein
MVRVSVYGLKMQMRDQHLGPLELDITALAFVSSLMTPRSYRPSLFFHNYMGLEFDHELVACGVAPVRALLNAGSSIVSFFEASAHFVYSCSNRQINGMIGIRLITRTMLYGS